MRPPSSRDPRRHEVRAPGTDATPRAHQPHPPAEGEEGMWHGITWRDVPGHDRSTQKLNFSLLKRGLLRRHEECTELSGEALKKQLKKISDRNKKNSREHQRNARPGRPRRQPTPPAPTPTPAPPPAPQPPDHRSPPPPRPPQPGRGTNPHLRNPG